MILRIFLMFVARVFAALLLFMSLAGCSQSPTPKLTDGVSVNGKVLLPNGSPLGGGTLVLRLFGATAQVQSDGTFKLQNSGADSIAPGQYQVFIRFTDPSHAKFKTAVNQRYQQSSDDGDSDVVVDIQSATEDLVIRLKR
jgi:hypothetical protein